MQYSFLGRTDIKVSRLCLGTMTWGEQNSESEAHAQLDYATGAGINFIDSAELYPVPPRAETQGRTEEYIGTWLKKRKARDQFIIATKICAQADWIPYLRDGQARLDRRNIETGLHDSLRRLQTDYVDLYQVHWPERDTNFFSKLGYVHNPDKDGIPIAESLAILGDFVKAGKIRHIGISNETPWGIAEYLRVAREHNLPRIVSIQNPYSLLNRTFEIGAAEFAHREQVGLLAYSPLGFGVLTGKYRHGARPRDARITLFSRFSRYVNELGIKSTDLYTELARSHGLDPAQMALAFVHSRPFLTSTIIGATSMQQLKSNIASFDIILSSRILEDIEDIHTQHPNPCP